MNMKPDMLTVEAAAAAMRKHPVTIRRMLAAGMLPTVKEGSRVFIPAAAVEAALCRVCLHCGKPFTPGRYASRGDYCSDPCRYAAVNAKRKTGKPMGRPPITRTAPDPASVPARLRAAVELIRRNRSQS